MNESPIPLLSPEVGFKHERVPPPPAAYVTKDDFLAVSVYTTSSTTGLKLAYRFLDSAGHTHYGSESLDGASTSTLTTKIFPLTEGWLLGLTVSNLGGGLADQVCFVLAALQRSGQASTAPHTVLAQGYVSNLFSVDWPPVYVRGPATSSGSSAGWITGSPDNPPLTPNALDDEFDTAILNVTTKWTWENQGTATATLANSNLILAEPTPVGSTDDLRIIKQATPAGDWAFTTKLALESYPQVYNMAGIILRDATAAKFMLLVIAYRTVTATNGYVPSVLYFDTVSHLSAYVWSPPIAYNQPIWPYLRVALTGTALSFQVSATGHSYTEVFTETATTHLTAGVGAVGLAICPLEQTSKPIAAVSDWFRRTA